MTKAFQIAATAFLITAAAIKAGPALAEPVAPTFNVSRVQTVDLDLSSPSGQRVLDVRLSHAAREVCGTASDADLVGKNDDRKCRADVLAKAYSQRDQLIAGVDRGTIIALSNAR